MNDKNEKIISNDISDDLIIIPKVTMDILLKQKKPAELISLYAFYYYTAKWQKTNRPYCTTSYASNGIKYGLNKIRRIKKQLKDIGLIDDYTVYDDKTKKIKGWYIIVKYIFKQETIKNHTTGIRDSGNESTLTEKPPVAKKTINSLSTDNINALSSDIKKKKQRVPDIVLGEYENVKLTQTEYENFKNKYPDIYKDCIEKLSSFIATKTKDPYSNHRAAMDSWVISAVKKDNNVSKQYKNSARQKDEMLIKSIQRSAENDRKRLQNSGGKDVRAIANSLLGHNFGMLDTSNNGTS